MMAISPLDIFSLALGGGATGLLLEHIVASRQLVWCAVAGALVFDLAIVKPLMSTMLRFASKPSEGLEGQIASIGEAVTPFDHQGRGLVKLTVDGQFTQLLATLDLSERDSGVTVSKGDKVMVIAVDPTSNICKVSRELAPSHGDDTLDPPTEAKGIGNTCNKIP